MSEQVITDPWAFARGRETLVGKIAVHTLDRIQEILSRNSTDIEFRINGVVSDKGEPGLHYAIKGALWLNCQRCMEPMAYVLEVDATVLLSKDAQAGQDDDQDAPEFILATQNLSVIALLEEEILLSLPMAPHHAEGQCSSQPQDHLDQAKIHPFAALARLKADNE